MHLISWPFALLSLIVAAISDFARLRVGFGWFQWNIDELRLLILLFILGCI